MCHCKDRLATAESKMKRREWGCRGKNRIFSAGTFLLGGMGHFQRNHNVLAKGKGKRFIL